MAWMRKKYKLYQKELDRQHTAERKDRIQSLIPFIKRKIDSWSDDEESGVLELKVPNRFWQGATVDRIERTREVGAALRVIQLYEYQDDVYELEYKKLAYMKYRLVVIKRC
jgi:hypothetical protein